MHSTGISPVVHRLRPFRPDLSPDYPSVDEPCGGNLFGFSPALDSHQCLRYSSRHSRIPLRPPARRRPSHIKRRNAPLPMSFYIQQLRRSSSPCTSAQERSISELYALFQGCDFLGQHLLAVSGTPTLLFSTERSIWGLSCDPGCFPLDDGAYPPSSHADLDPCDFMSKSTAVASTHFRAKQPSSGFEWHFTPNHNSSADSSTISRFGPPLSFTQASSWSWIDHPATAYESPAQFFKQARGQSRRACLPTALERYGFVFYFTPRGGVLFIAFPHERKLRDAFGYWDFHHLGAAFRLASPRGSTTLYCSPTIPRFHGFMALPFRSPLLRNRLLLSFPLLLRCFSSPALSLALPIDSQPAVQKVALIRNLPDLCLLFNSPRAFRSIYALLVGLWLPEGSTVSLPRLNARRFIKAIAIPKSAKWMGSYRTSMENFERHTSRSVIPYSEFR
nr:Metallocarboxypeptidase inhibitor [Ipomoea batatas]